MKLLLMKTMVVLAAEVRFAVPDFAERFTVVALNVLSVTVIAVTAVPPDVLVCALALNVLAVNVPPPVTLMVVEADPAEPETVEAVRVLVVKVPASSSMVAEACPVPLFERVAMFTVVAVRVLVA